MLAGKSGVIGVVVCVALLGLPVTFCQDLPFPSKVAPPPPAPPRNWCSDHIDFVSHYHGFAQSHGGKDHRNWYIRADRNPYVPPPGDSMQYIFARLHRPFAAGDAALLVSPMFEKPVFIHPDLSGLVDDTEHRCTLEFDYYANHSLLSAFLHHTTDTITDNSNPVWTSDFEVNGAVGDSVIPGWRRGSLSLGAVDDTFLVTFEAVCGGGVNQVCTPGSLSAVSHIQLSVGCCLKEVVRQRTCSSDVYSFENGLEGFQQPTTDDFDWTRNFGPTESLKTGPRHDHTTGKGAYMYAESTARAYGDYTDLVSPVWDLAAGCRMSFWYLMFGLKMGTLQVFTVSHMNDSTSLPPVLVFNQTVEKGAEWFNAVVNISLASEATAGQVIFRATVTASPSSDIAIDDVQLLAGCCATPTEQVTKQPTPEATLTSMNAGGNVTRTEGQKNTTGGHRISVGIIFAILAPILVIVTLIAAFFLFRYCQQKHKQSGEPRHQRQENETEGIDDVNIEANEATTEEETAA